LSRVLACALAPEVRVCGVAPGSVAVEPGQADRRAAETLLRRVGEPAVIAEAVLFLANAGYVTGATVVVDGRRMLKSAGRPTPVPATAPSRAGSPGACTARSRSSRSASARCSHSRTGAASLRAKSQNSSTSRSAP